MRRFKCLHRYHIECWHDHGVGILVALSVSKFLHAFRATNFLLREVVWKLNVAALTKILFLVPLSRNAFYPQPLLYLNFR